MWDWAIWIGLGIAVLATISAGATLGLRALSAWRQLTAVRRSALEGLDALAAAGARTAEKAGSVGDTAALQESTRRLRSSLARLAVLRNALGEVQDMVGLLTSFVPRR